MLISMTGFGRATVEAPFGKIIVEIQSVNRKHLEMSIFLPKEYSRFELDIRKWLAEVLSRGQIVARIHVVFNPERLHSFFSLDQIKSFKKEWEKIASHLGYDPAVVTFPFLMEKLSSQPSVELAKDEDLAFFRKGIDQALLFLLEMKRLEGAILFKDIEKRLVLMEQSIESIELLIPEAILRMKKKFQEKILEVASQLMDDEERILREIAIFAEKADVTEEIVRFRSHIVQFRSLLNTSSSVGRKMEFLVQEMSREINTIGSKSLEAKLTPLVIEVKSELEKIKEQIQNIE